MSRCRICQREIASDQALYCPRCKLDTFSPPAVNSTERIDRDAVRNKRTSKLLAAGLVILGSAALARMLDGPPSDREERIGYLAAHAVLSATGLGLIIAWAIRKWLAARRAKLRTSDLPSATARQRSR